MKSDALRINLRETAVDRVVIDPQHETLRGPVHSYAGIHSSLDRLLLELNHPFRNWKLILPELRSFALKNITHYVAHPDGPHCVVLFSGIFLQALAETGKTTLHRAALEGLTATIGKLVSLLKQEHLPNYSSALSNLFERLSRLSDKHLLLLAQNHSPLKRTTITLLGKIQRECASRPCPVDLTELHRLALRSLRLNYSTWLSRKDPITFRNNENDSIFKSISHDEIRACRDRLEEIAKQPVSSETILQLTELPSYLDMVRHHKRIVDGFGNHAENLAGESQRLRFLFYIMETKGLRLIHEETLKEINRSLVHLIHRQRFEEIEVFFLETFRLLQENVIDFPHTALQCIEVLGMEVLRRDNGRLMEAYLEQAVRFGFQYSNIQGVGTDWQPRGNPAHLYNIRVWLHLINAHPKWCSTLLSALVIHLKLTGTCIRDTDLFQKDVTCLLNSDVRPIYALVKQFTRQLPVYYHEIGAEGELRDVSTELDEITQRQDLVIHFLRKQCHVESSNLIVDFVRAILKFWKTRDKTALVHFMPSEILEDVAENGPWIDSIHTALTAHGEIDLTTRPLEEIKNMALPRRVVLLVQLYHLLVVKYNLGTDSSESPDSLDSLDKILSRLEELQKIILSQEQFSAQEEIYQKRHIAVGIPSIYGEYHEPKFDALSLSFRLEILATRHLEALIDKIREGFITRAAFFKVVKYMHWFLRALALDGLISKKLERYLGILERSLHINSLSFHQYLDIFRGFSEGIQDLIHIEFTSQHRDNLTRIIPAIPKRLLLSNRTCGESPTPPTGKYVHLEDGDSVNTLERVQEAFLRDMIGEAFGLQAFDRFVTRVRKILERQEGKLEASHLDLLMNYDPARLFSLLHHPNMRTRDLIHLGNKGYHLLELAEMAMPVPPGVILSTEFYRCRHVISHYAPARQDFLEQLKRHILHLEQATGMSFGAKNNPLLVSIRSGALISMPGMLQSIPNVGINETIVRELSRRSGNTFFAWDNYRRFVQSWSMACGLGREIFNRLMRQAKKKHQILKKREFSANQMADLARSYRDTAMANGVTFPEDPWEQLLQAIDLVLNSWHMTKSAEYRRIMNISSDWGTAVIIQAMVFGNLHQKSGTGVFFTAHPNSTLNRVALWGDYTPGNQGEDIVSGLVTTLPISTEQAKLDGRDPKVSLERCFPKIYGALLKFSRKLIYQKRWHSQEIEFTFDGPQEDNLFLLQTREMVTERKPPTTFFKNRTTEHFQKNLLAQGIGVSGGALRGRAVFNLEHIQRLRDKTPNVPLILIRYDTVPDDIKEISLTEGLLTTRGGQTSHAAIVAVRLEKTCIVGCEAVVVQEERGQCQVDDEIIHVGDAISIDGHNGFFLKGWHDLERVVIG